MLESFFCVRDFIILRRWGNKIENSRKKKLNVLNSAQRLRLPLLAQAPWGAIVVISAALLFFGADFAYGAYRRYADPTTDNEERNRVRVRKQQEAKQWVRAETVAYSKSRPKGYRGEDK